MPEQLPTMRFSIERACPDQAQALCAIERKAVQLFRGHAVWPSYAGLAIPAELLQRSIAQGVVWVALDDTAAPVGFIWLDTELDGDAIGIAELNVLPSHGRRGIGAALLEHACEWARAAGYRQVDLGTLPDVPWNAPFYARHGFVVVGAQDPDFAFARQRDLENGFPAHLRVFMRRQLPLPLRNEKKRS